MAHHQIPAKISLNPESNVDDNIPTVGASLKMFTTARPLEFGLQLLAAWASHLQADADLSFVPGEANFWADGLSRGYVNVISQFDPRRRLKLPLKTLLKVRLR